MLGVFSISIAGIIGWIGLVIPHVARLLVGPDFGRLMPVSILLGAGFLLAVDTLARTMAAMRSAGRSALSDYKTARSTSRRCISTTSPM